LKDARICGILGPPVRIRPEAAYFRAVISNQPSVLKKRAEDLLRFLAGRLRDCVRPGRSLIEVIQRLSGRVFLADLRPVLESFFV
jgi:hypothetical protein